MTAHCQAIAPPSTAPWLIVRSLRMADDRMRAWLAGLRSLGFETYYPQIRELRPIPRRQLSHAQRVSDICIMRPRVVAFLPQMIFIRGGNGAWLGEHPGVIGFVSVGTEPAHISDMLIMRLRAREAAGEGGAIPGKTPVEYIFRLGDVVEVVNGPFATMHAKVDAIPVRAIEDIDADTRLRLTLDLFGRATVINTSVANVRKL